jgi:hypothetical protein
MARAVTGDLHLIPVDGRGQCVAGGETTPEPTDRGSIGEVYESVYALCGEARTKWRVSDTSGSGSRSAATVGLRHPHASAAAGQRFSAARRYCLL